MCGRYTIHTSANQIAMRFEAQGFLGELRERYNVAPTQKVAVVVENLTESGQTERTLTMMRWGIVPFWAKPGPTGVMPAGSRARDRAIINAMGETVAEKNTFRGMVKKRRCILPADGFYEWLATPGEKAKTPIHFRRKDGGLFGFAGLWDEITGEDGEKVQRCLLITTAPNNLVAPVHNRMPRCSPTPSVSWRRIRCRVRSIRPARTIRR